MQAADLLIACTDLCRECTHRHPCVLHLCFPDKLLMCDSVSGHMTKWIIDFGVSGVWAGNRRLPVRAPFRRRLHQRWRYYCTAGSTLSCTTHRHSTVVLDWLCLHYLSVTFHCVFRSHRSHHRAAGADSFALRFVWQVLQRVLQQERWDSLPSVILNCRERGESWNSCCRW